MRSTPPRSASPRTEESANQCSSLFSQRGRGRAGRGRCWRRGAPGPALPPHLQVSMRLALSKHGPLPAAAYAWGEAPEPPTARPLGPIRCQAPEYAATLFKLQHCRTPVFWLRKWGASRDLGPIRFMPTPCFPSQIFHPDPQLLSPSRGSPTPYPQVQVVSTLTGHLNGALALPMALPSPEETEGGVAPEAL